MAAELALEMNESYTLMSLQAAAMLLRQLGLWKRWLLSLVMPMSQASCLKLNLWTVCLLLMWAATQMATAMAARAVSIGCLPLLFTELVKD